jgi:hypothetical protein
MPWPEQTKIEEHAPAYLRNAIRIITETGLRVYKELAPMKVPLTEIAAEAFRSQIELAGPGPWQKMKLRCKALIQKHFYGGRDRTRTCDLLRVKQAL